MRMYARDNIFLYGLSMPEINSLIEYLHTFKNPTLILERKSLQYLN